MWKQWKHWRTIFSSVSKITTSGDCSHEIKRYLLLGRKAMSNLDSILKSRDTTLPTKVGLVKAMVFRVVMYGCESWAIKKDEHWRIDAFELWCWRRLLRVPWTARRYNQSILKEISPGCSLEVQMLKLKLWYFGHLMQRADSFEKTDDEKDWGQEERGLTEDEMVGWHHQLNGHGFVWTRSWWWTERPGVLRFMGSQRVRHDQETELYNAVLVSVVQQRESALCIHISPPHQVFLPPPPPIPPGHHRAELPVLYSSFPLASYFTHESVYMSMLLSQFVSSSPSAHPMSTSLFSTSASLFLPSR